jgi:hypothetical protein
MLEYGERKEIEKIAKEMIDNKQVHRLFVLAKNDNLSTAIKEQAIACIEQVNPIFLLPFCMKVLQSNNVDPHFIDKIIKIVGFEKIDEEINKGFKISQNVLDYLMIKKGMSFTGNAEYKYSKNFSYIRTLFEDGKMDDAKTRVFLQNIFFVNTSLKTIAFHNCCMPRMSTYNHFGNSEMLTEISHIFKSSNTEGIINPFDYMMNPKSQKEYINLVVESDLNDDIKKDILNFIVEIEKVSQECLKYDRDTSY